MKRIELKVNHIEKVDGPVNYLKKYLIESVGIKEKDLDSFLIKPKDEDLDDPFDLTYMKEAVAAAYDRLSKGVKVAVQVDSDTDGYSSSSILINYLKRRFPTTIINYYLHPGKEHGIIPDDYCQGEELIFIPDAGSNDYAQQEELSKQGKLVIVLDHHEINKDDYRNTGAIIVNNQNSPYFTNKSLSGAGVTLMFIKAMDSMYFNEEESIWQDYMDLAAVGIIADAMNMTTLGNNYITYYGLNNIKNKFIHELAVKQERGIKNPDHLTKMDVMFYIAPVINGVIRSGEPLDKQYVFSALIRDDGEKDDIKTTWRGIERHENLYQYATRLAVNAKSRQDNSKKKSFEWLVDKIKEEGWNKDNLIIATMDAKESNKVSANITGLIATELVKYFNKPCLVLRETEYEGKDLYGGSGRNGNFYGLNGLLNFVEESGDVYYAAGHQSAFGVFIEKDKVAALREYANNQLDAAVFNDKVYAVDYWFTKEFLHDGNEEYYTYAPKMLNEFAEREDLWGNSIPRPLFAFDIRLNSMNEVQLMGKDNSSLKIHDNDVDFVSFKNEQMIKELKDRLEDGPCYVTIVGSPSLNEFRDKKSIQIIIDDYSIVGEHGKTLKSNDEINNLINSLL